MDNSLIQINVYKRSWRVYILLATALSILSVLADCGPSSKDLAIVSYAPVVSGTTGRFQHPRPKG